MSPSGCPALFRRARQDAIKRVASAVGDGATVIRLVHKHVRTDTRKPAVT